MVASDSTIGYATATIAGSALLGDSPIGYAVAEIASKLVPSVRVGGVWVSCPSPQVLIGGVWRAALGGQGETDGTPSSAVGFASTRIAAQYSPEVLASRPAEGSIDTHTGVPIVWWESLYQPGDQVWQALNRASSACVVSFPAGEFTLTDFKATERGTGAQTGSAVNLTKNVIHGIIGMGRGSYNSNTGTRFMVAENSSTWAAGVSGWTPTQAMGGTTQIRVFRSVDHAGKMHMADFSIRGATQPHLFHGLAIEAVTGDVLIESVLVAGWSGDAGAPPGETSGIIVAGAPSAAPKVIIRNSHVDGRYPDGTIGGTTGIHLQRTLNAEVTDCSALNIWRAGSMINYHTVGTTWRRCVMGSDTDPTNGQAWPFNAECNTGVRIIDCHFGRANKLLHATFSNADHTQVIGGTTYPTANGTLTVIGGDWGPSGIGGAGNKFAVQSWTSGIDGSNNDTMSTPPVVVDANGYGQEFRWVHGTHQDIQSPNIEV